MTDNKKIKKLNSKMQQFEISLRHLEQRINQKDPLWRKTRHSMPQKDEYQ